MRLNAFFCCCLLLTFSTGAHLTAETLVHYEANQDYVTADDNFQRTAQLKSSAPYIYTNPFSSSSPLSPSNEYQGPVFYGGYQFSSSLLETGLTRQQVRDDVSGFGQDTDQIFLQAWRKGGWLDSTLSLSGIYLFQQADFDQPYHQGNVTLQALNVRWHGYGSADPLGDPIEIIGRFVVRIGKDYYVSQNTMELKSKGDYELSGNELKAEKWSPYDPEKAFNVNVTKTKFADLELENVTAVGIQFEAPPWSGTDTNNAAFGLGIVSFEAQGTNLQ